MPTYCVEDFLATVPESMATGRMGDFSLTEKDMRVALALFRLYKPKRVLDFGCNQGHTASFLLENCPWIELWVGVDLKPEMFPQRGIVPKLAGRLARGDDRFHAVLTDETIPDMARQLLMNGWSKFDAIIMDANHEDWATKRDTEGCEPHAASPCLWLWHDYNVESRQHSNGKPFSLKGYLDSLERQGHPIMFPDEVDRDPWRCCSLAWEVSQ
ncbi:MAG: class I SAM-dependent methyltransferase [Bryobacterales bacterium]|nr:class I SAM-dependent methyltransferase [Bryobacterales bacterium]